MVAGVGDRRGVHGGLALQAAMRAMASGPVTRSRTGDPPDQHPARLEWVPVRASNWNGLLPPAATALVQASGPHNSTVVQLVDGHPTHAVAHTFEA